MSISKRVKSSETMVDDYICRKDTLTELCDYVCGELVDPCNFQKDCKYYRIIESIEPADVVPVVRCRDCKHYEGRRWCGLNETNFDPDEFCSYGERKE